MSEQRLINPEVWRIRRLIRAPISIVVAFVIVLLGFEIMPPYTGRVYSPLPYFYSGRYLTGIAIIVGYSVYTVVWGNFAGIALQVGLTKTPDEAFLLKNSI